MKQTTSLYLDMATNEQLELFDRYLTRATLSDVLIEVMQGDLDYMMFREPEAVLDCLKDSLYDWDA